jgi:hypothetical protein
MHIFGEKKMCMSTAMWVQIIRGGDRDEKQGICHGNCSCADPGHGS